MLYPTLWREPTASLWDGMFNIRREFDRLLDRSFGSQVAATSWVPPVDVRETSDALVLQAELPGLSSEDVDVSVENGVLTIAGEKKNEFEEGQEGSSFHVWERRYGRFERSFRLPRGVDAEHVKAEFADGVLTVTLPKTDEAKPRRIQIEVGDGSGAPRLGGKK